MQTSPHARGAPRSGPDGASCACDGYRSRGIANGTSGVAQGGGIWNGQPFGPDETPTPTLLVDHSAVLGNALRASPGPTVQGGGLFTTGFAASLASSLIAHNTPDQCVGS